MIVLFALAAVVGLVVLVVGVRRRVVCPWSAAAGLFVGGCAVVAALLR